MKKAFTLVEMLVVIGILGVLTAITIVAMSSGSESALNIKCESNLKNLATACHNYGMATKHYPLAGSIETMTVKRQTGSKVERKYSEIPGWLAWNSGETFRRVKEDGTVENITPGAHCAQSSWFTSTYTEDDDARKNSYTNGALWKYVSSNTEVFRCPCHVNKFKNNPPAWSYVMNGYFGWDNSVGSKAKNGSYEQRKPYGSLKFADRRLLFAEIQFEPLGGLNVDTSSDPGTKNDCTLQYSGEYAEMIGFNHKSGKKNRFALVVFADGHTERISIDKADLSEANLKELTRLLCEGIDYGLKGNKFQQLN